MTFPTKNRTCEFIYAYCEAMLWTCTATLDDNAMPCDHGDDITLSDAGFTVNDISRESMRNIRADCVTWMWENRRLLYDAATQYDDTSMWSRSPSVPYSAWALHGYDYWLTRNGHGAGFWDRGLGDIGDKLTEACERSEVWAYVGNDGQVWVN